MVVSPKQLEVPRAVEELKEDPQSLSSEQLKLAPVSESKLSKTQKIAKFVGVLIENFNSHSNAHKIYLREAEQSEITSFITKNQRKQCSRLMYLCGHPGTGKTSSLNHVLKSDAFQGTELAVFKYNAMRFANVMIFGRRLYVDLA